MEALLLDTTVLSFLFREGPKNDLAKRYESITRGKISMISFQSVAELWKWAEESEWGLKRRNRLENFIQKFQIIPVDYELSRTWARVCAQSRRRGRCLSAADAWIIATAVRRDLALLTHDKDMIGLDIPGLRVISCLE